MLHTNEVKSDKAISCLPAHQHVGSHLAPRFSDDIHACASAVFEHVGIRNWLHVPAGVIVFSQSKIYGISRVFSTNINFRARKTSIKIEIYGKKPEKDENGVIFMPDGLPDRG